MVFFSILFVIEIIFFTLLKTKIISPRLQTAPYYKSLSRDETVKKYGPPAFEIPAKFSAEKSYNWQLNQLTTRNTKQSLEPHYYGEMYQRNIRDSKVTSHLTVNDLQQATIYRLDYGFDSNGNRKTVVGSASSSDTNLSTRFILALGDSFTFGEGVSENHTYPSILGSLLGQDFNVINFGFPGVSPQQILERLIKPNDKLSWIPQSEGDAIYLFLPIHLERVFCRLQCTTSDENTLTKPAVVFDKDQITMKGQIKDIKDFNRLFLNALSQSQLIKYLNFEYPKHYSPIELTQFARLIQEVRLELQKHKKINRFIFVNVFPFEQKQLLFSALAKHNIIVLDFSDIPYPDVLQHPTIPIDSHPTSEFYYMLSQLIFQSVFK